MDRTIFGSDHLEECISQILYTKEIIGRILSKKFLRKISITEIKKEQFQNWKRLSQPNGIIGSEKLKKLFVSDINAGKTYVYDILGD